MAQELTVSFVSVDRFTIAYKNQTTTELLFTSPLTKEDWKDMRWYLEVYATQYAADVDDDRADRVVAKLAEWGKGLFTAVFGDPVAARIFNDFQDAENQERQISIAASPPEILRLPWELLCDSQGTFLLHENPRIALRRQFAGAGSGRSPISVKPKETLRLLMVVSRPKGAGFIDPRAEGQAVLQAIEKSAPGRIVVEFLRPATLKSLRERLGDKKLPAIDILHFDGHGVFAANSEAGAGKHDGLTKGISENMGCLLFEDADGGQELVDAQILGNVFNRQKISLVVLSACQSAMVGEDENNALGCLAAKLTDVGIPAVLAMTYSVLVKTTEQLFGKFYGDLSGGESLGVALASARQDLYFEQKRGKRWRGTEQIDLKLADWFLPAWYQAGGDIKLLKSAKKGDTPVAEDAPGLRQLPNLQEEGFFGRSRELWTIEQAFVRGARRITIAGFGGQGKTYLAAEVGRWLVQTGMFEVVCFVDYAAFQGVDAVGYAVSMLGVALEQSLLDGVAVTGVLRQRRSLVILDNLESLATDTLGELLNVAKGWSEAGESRLLLTTRDGGISHGDYPAANSVKHQLLKLAGLGEEDALAYFQGLMKLPPVPQWDLPVRDALLELFKLVDFHPLSIRLVALQLKERRIGDLARSLELLLADGQGSLVASLNLSLQRLDSELLKLLPKLGVFQGGALEGAILHITEMEAEQWNQLKLALVRNGLVQIEAQSEFLKFHPTLSPFAFNQLSTKDQEDLIKKHCLSHYFIVRELYFLDDRNPNLARNLFVRNMPNILFALNISFKEKTIYKISFLDFVSKFMLALGLKKEYSLLIDQSNKLNPEDKSLDWAMLKYTQAEQLKHSGKYSDAIEIYTTILNNTDEQPSYIRITILITLADCLRITGHLSNACNYSEIALRSCEVLEQNNEVTNAEIQGRKGMVQHIQGDILMDQGYFSLAEESYENALISNQIAGNLRQLSIVEFQICVLYQRQGYIRKAFSGYLKVLEDFRQIQEPDSEAMVLNHLGILCEENQRMEEAEMFCRESAKISERSGNTKRAVEAYNHLATLNWRMNYLNEAENWYLKTLQADELIDDKVGKSKTLCNLANLLVNQPDRLPEALKFALQALHVKENLAPEAAVIWTVYNVLARISTLQGDVKQSNEYRQLARSAKEAFAGTQYELQQHEPLIVAVVAAVSDHAAAEQLEPQLTKNSKTQLVVAIRCILAGERSIKALWGNLNADEFMIIQAIIDRLS
jgi:tetratricopeptide (TPR) repeat protein